jgi:hypothetical protein
MGKKTKALSGASLEAYFRRVLQAIDLSDDQRTWIVQRLRGDIALLRVRKGAHAEPNEDSLADSSVANLGGAAVAPKFDPFTPNVIVVLRKEGRDAALAALATIESAQDLRSLAREQRLHIDGDLSSNAAIRLAIVTAAERRIANRMAAAT